MFGVLLATLILFGIIINHIVQKPFYNTYSHSRKGCVYCTNTCAAKKKKNIPSIKALANCVSKSIEYYNVP